jgi:hypothetical protein
MNYIDFTVTRFLSDASFREWVLSPDTANKLYWEDWCRRHPGQQEEVALARQLIAQGQWQPDYLPEARVESLWAAIEAEVDATPLTPPAAKGGRHACGSLMAAVFLGLLVAGLAIYRNRNKLTKSL